MMTYFLMAIGCSSVVVAFVIALAVVSADYGKILSTKGMGFVGEERDGK